MTRPWEQLEADLESAHKSMPGWYVARQNPEVQNFKGVWTPTDRGEPDFLGVHLAHGGILFDAKHCASSRWPVCKDGPIVRGKQTYIGLQPHQRVSLNRFASRGMRAGVVCRLAGADVWFAIEVIEPLWAAWWQDHQVRTIGAGDGIVLTGLDWRVVL